MIATDETGFARGSAEEVRVPDRGRIVDGGAPAPLFGDPAQAATRRFLARVPERA